MPRTYKPSAPKVRNISTTLAIIGVIIGIAALFLVRFTMRDLAKSYAENSDEEYRFYKEQITLAAPPVLFEGLPNPESEPDLYLVESLRPDTAKFRGHYRSDSLHIYTDPLPLGDLEAMQLANIINDVSILGPKNAASACGSFHADYAIRFERPPASPVNVFICFGCSEIQFTSDLPPLARSLSISGEKQLKALLASKIQNRPNGIRKSFFEQAVELNEKAPNN